jgi:hypothetical protein
MTSLHALAASSLLLTAIALKNPMCHRLHVQSALIDITHQCEDMNRQIQKLESDIKALHSNKGLEHAIRDDLGWVRKGKKELIIVFEEPSGL